MYHSWSHLSCTRRLPSPIGANLVATTAISRLYADQGLVIPNLHLAENRRIPAGSIAWRLATYIHFAVPVPTAIPKFLVYQAFSPSDWLEIEHFLQNPRRQHTSRRQNASPVHCSISPDSQEDLEHQLYSSDVLPGRLDLTSTFASTRFSKLGIGTS